MKKTDSLRMDRSHMTERILNLTLEIIYLLTGEDYTVVKKTSDECETLSNHPRISEGLSWTQSPITVPPPHSLIHERNNDQRILELTNKIIQLLTGEVPIRCEDVTVYFSMEEWEYLDGHRGLYKDLMMENHRPLISLDGYSKRNTPERCPCRLYSQDCTDEKHNISQDYQVENMTDVKIDLSQFDGEEETCVKGDQQCKEKTPTDISTAGQNSRNTLEGHLILSPDCKIEDNNITDSTAENPISPNIRPVHHNADMSPDPSTHGRFSPDNSDIIRHNTAHRGGDIFSCSECNKYFTHNEKLPIHKKVHKGEKSFPCSDCGKCFSLKWILVCHKRIHTGEKPFPCSECGKCFTLKSNLVKHQKTHTGEKPFSCSECGKCFTQNSYLVEHQRIHTGEKPFACSECRKCFTQKSYLIEHHKIHTGEKPFACSECGKYFTKNSSLVEHHKIHTGKKPYPCAECGKCFTQKSTLVVHLRTHTGEKPFPCSHCGKWFTQKSALVEHQRIHTGEKPFPCSQCGKCFTKKSNLVEHQKIHTRLHL